ncbi:hypothetical protein SeLEV6574_g02509 [Synchytrium endobioticum]|uniref:Chromo domain-containing protein n=1 Tax=Synchytrium endobioticum TaxID=286115 RepID=A0A507D8N9_9FUNG|nr:hypothetical protein SeLEV6574_g02509 [Synchytrium endobioticum]
MSPFYAVTGQDANIEQLGTAPSHVVIPNPPEAGRIKQQFDQVFQHQKHLEPAQKRYKSNADRRRTEEISFDIGDEVLVSTKNVRTERPSKNLEYKYMGPIHPVFHISLLERYIEAEDGERGKPPPPLKLNYEEGFVIEEILNARRRGRGFEYLIAWEGFGPEDRTWEPRTSLNDDVMLRSWHQSYPENPSPFALRN